MRHLCGKSVLQTRANTNFTNMPSLETTLFVLSKSRLIANIGNCQLGNFEKSIPQKQRIRSQKLIKEKQFKQFRETKRKTVCGPEFLVF